MLELRPYQTAAITAIYKYFGENKGHPIVVIPTAGGKSLVMASFIEGVLKAWPDQRILIVTHVRELIAQNHAEMLGLWPEAPAGVYSAGLGRREADARILFAGIQSIHRRPAEIGFCDLVLVDEAHLIPGDSSTMYRKLIGELAAINPLLKVIGFTATPFRLDSGMLHEGENALFTDIAFEVSVRDLIDKGYLCPLVSKRPNTRLDVTGVGTRGGEYIASELQAAVDKEAITRAAIDEVVSYGADRKSWLLFCSGVDHATHVAEEVRRRGLTCATIFGSTPKEERDAIITAFKNGEIRALASMGVLTTGFNAPAVDLIAMLRPTKSAGLYVQMAGRGTRLAPGKEHCLVLDFAGNVSRHGPIDLVKPKKPGDAGSGEAPVKVCPECDTIVPIAVAECPECGFEFPGREVKIQPTASTLAVISTRSSTSQWVNVSDVTYSRHDKVGGRTSLKVHYRTGLIGYDEWICLEHDGLARRKAEAWWRRRGPMLPMPSRIDDALSLVARLAKPTQILVRLGGRYPEILDYRFAPCASPMAGSVPSAIARPAASAGSTSIIPFPTRAGSRAFDGSATGPARTSSTGEKA
jgi:DNA repair protein RadD